MPTVGEDVLNRNRPSHDDIRTYFTELHAGYDRKWAPGVHEAAMHFGYFDDEHEEFGPAMFNMKRKLADAADVGPGDRVLEAGCGLGEPATWLAAERDAEVLGINISESQLERAREVARDRGVTDSVEFRYDDFTEMETLDDDSFDVVWGLESICYADSKPAVVEQAARVLDDGGRIVVGDWFMTERELTDHQRRIVELWLEGWKIPDLAHVEDFEAALSEFGFEDVTTHDATENILPSVSGFRCRTRRKITWPLSRVLNRVGLVGDYRMEHERGCYYQHEVYEEDLVTYGIVRATR